MTVNVKTMPTAKESLQISRKFGYATGLSMLSTIALITNKANMNQWIEFNRFLFTTYVMGNVTQKTLTNI